MTSPDDKIKLVEVIHFLDDPLLQVRDNVSHEILRELLDPEIHDSLQKFNEQTDEEFLELWLKFIRSIDADFGSFRQHLTRQLRMLDLIQEIQSIDDHEQARLVLETNIGVKQLQADLIEMAKASKKRIDPTGYYSYDEAVDAVGVSESTLRRQVKEGNLRQTSIGGRVTFLGRDLLDFQKDRSRFKILGDN
jgi:Helix-turn-helix domain